MAGHGAPEQRPVDCHELRVAVVAASWHEQVMDGLIDGARRALKDYRVEEPKVVRVPGTLVLGLDAESIAVKGYDAVVPLIT
jgi:6,7-dimethyl-8-ribityllumazine synthase